LSYRPPDSYLLHGDVHFQNRAHSYSLADQKGDIPWRARLGTHLFHGNPSLLGVRKSIRLSPGDGGSRFAGNIPTSTW
jgi:hypothetical protein